MNNFVSKEKYAQIVKDKTPNSKLLVNMSKAYLVGGLICVVGQIFLNVLKNKGLSAENASNLTTMIMIFLGAFFTGINVYDNLGKFAGAGSIVPITGFANSIVAPAMEFKSEGYVMGVGARMFVIAGPVLVFGIVMSIISGIIYFVFNLG